MHKKIVHSFLTTFLITFILGFGLLYVSLYKASISQDRQYLMNTVKLVKNLEIDDLNTTRLGDTFKSEDIKSGLISVNSPIARGLVGKELDDTVNITTPGGTVEFEIIEVNYI